MLAERLDFESDRLSVRAGDGLAGEIDREYRIGALAGVLQQQVDFAGLRVASSSWAPGGGST